MISLFGEINTIFDKERHIGFLVVAVRQGKENGRKENYKI